MKKKEIDPAVSAFFKGIAAKSWVTRNKNGKGSESMRATVNVRWDAYRARKAEEEKAASKTANKTKQTKKDNE